MRRPLAATRREVDLQSRLGRDAPGPDRSIPTLPDHTCKHGVNFASSGCTNCHEIQLSPSPASMTTVGRPVPAEYKCIVRPSTVKNSPGTGDRADALLTEK